MTDKDDNTWHLQLEKKWNGPTFREEKEMNIQTVPDLTENEIARMQDFKKFLEEKVITTISTIFITTDRDYALISDLGNDCHTYITQIDALLEG